MASEPPVRVGKRTWLIDLLAATVLIAIVLAGYRYWQTQQPAVDRWIEPDPACDLQAATCHVALGGGATLAVQFSPQPVPVLTPFRVEVSVVGRPVQSASLVFSGVDMAMGEHPVALKAEGAGRFVGEAVLPVCVTGQMKWRATVHVEREDKVRYAVPFQFVSKR